MGSATDYLCKVFYKACKGSGVKSCPKMILASTALYKAYIEETLTLVYYTLDCDPHGERALMFKSCHLKDAHAPGWWAKIIA